MRNYKHQIRVLILVLACFFSAPLLAQTSPKIIFSSLYGGAGTDDCDAVTVDSESNTYLGCHLSSADLPGSDKYKYSLKENMDAFVVKLNRDNNSVGYITHWGGKEWEAIQGLVSDDDGNIFVVGTTYSKDLQVSATALQPSFGGGSDVFVSKINPSGSIVWTTYFGDNGDEDSSDIVLDKQGNIHIAGKTSSANLPTNGNSYQRDLSGGSDAFIATFDSNGRFVYVSYLGGSEDDVGRGFAIDSAGKLFISGFTHSSDFPVMNALNTELSGNEDAFVAVLNAQGNSLEFSTYLGGSGADRAVGLGINDRGDIIVVGDTSSPDLPPSSIDSTFGGGISDVFVARINITQPALAYLSYFGGNGTDRVLNMELSESGKAVLVGDTTSSDFPISYDFRAGETNENVDGYIAVFDLQTKSKPMSILGGGTAIDTFEGIAIEADGLITVAGASSSTDLPETAPIQTEFMGGRFDILVAKFRLDLSE